MSKASEKKVRFGFFGAGSIVIFRHAAELFQNPEAELVAVYDPLTERAENLAERFQIERVAKSEEDILKDKTIDAVVVATPNSEHARLTIAALKAGKHVLCEKPMATTLEDAAKMIAASEKYGKKLMIGHNQCLMPHHLKAKKLLEEGAIGDIITFRTCFGHGGPEGWSQDKGPHTWFFKKEKAYVGSMGDLGVHKAYLLPYLLGTEFAEVGAFIETKDKKNEKGKPITVDDNAVCIVKMANGVIGQLTASWTYYGKGDNSTAIYGTKGAMFMGTNPDFQIEVYNRGTGESAHYKVGAIATNAKQTKSGIPDLFVQCIQEDLPIPFTGQKGYNALATVVACMESAATKKMVKVNYKMPKVTLK